MMRLKSDLLPALLATADGVLETFDLRWHDDAALTVVMAAKGYPGDYAKGTPDRGARRGARACEGVEIFHAGTRARRRPAARQRRPRAQRHGARQDGRRGAARAPTRPIAKIDWPGGFCRRDIGWRAIAREKRSA